MNIVTILSVIGLVALVFGLITPDYGLMASATGNNNGNYGGNHGGNNHDDNSSYGSPKVKVYKVVINNDGNPTPTMTSFGIKLKDTLVTNNGTTFTIPKNKPVTLTESGSPGYEFVEIRGDGHCPENLGGTITLDNGQKIECYIVNQPVSSGGGDPNADPPSVKVYKVVINNSGNPTPSAESFGLSINGGPSLSNGTKITLHADTPAILTETGLAGYEFVEIRGDGNCPENLGGTMTLSAGQDIECYIVNQPIDQTGPPDPGVIFHYNTLSFSFADMTFGDSCSAPGKSPPCIELANSVDGNVLVVDSELQTDTTIVLFSVVETDKVTQTPPQFATSPICVLSGVGPHTVDYAQASEISPVTNPSGQIGFEFQCSLIEADTFKVSYALIETQRQ
jgi:hypothetical protein